MKEGEKSGLILASLIVMAENSLEKFPEMPIGISSPKTTNLISPLLEKPRRIPPSHTLFINQRHTSGRRRY
jgi:hypothetical protein